MAAGFPVKANWSAGDIYTAAGVDDMAATLNYLQFAPPRNAVLNSNFSVWQRGTSVAIAAASTSAYQADRWQGYRGVAGSTVSRQATSDTTNLPNIQYCARVQRDSGNAATNIIVLTNNFETLNSIPFAGKAVTLSFYARAGANYSAASNALAITLATGTGTDQNSQSGYTGASTAISQTSTLTTTWQRFQYTATLAATATELAIQFGFTPTGTAGTNDYFEITGVQLELGSTASTYYPNGSTYQAELAACQRYYYRMTNAQPLGVGMAVNSTTGMYSIFFPVQMRSTPTFYCSQTANQFSVTNGTDGSVVCSALPGTNLGSPYSFRVSGTVASGLTAGQGSILFCNNSAAFGDFSAEL